LTQADCIFIVVVAMPGKNEAQPSKEQSDDAGLNSSKKKRIPKSGS
jgi:hypothetical protein